MSVIPAETTSRGTCCVFSRATHESEKGAQNDPQEEKQKTHTHTDRQQGLVGSELGEVGEVRHVDMQIYAYAWSVCMYIRRSGENHVSSALVL